MFWLLILPHVCNLGHIWNCFLEHTLDVPGIMVIGGGFFETLALTRVSRKFFGLLYPNVTCLGNSVCLVEALSAKMGQFFLIDCLIGGFSGLKVVMKKRPSDFFLFLVGWLRRILVLLADFIMYTHI